MAEGIKHFLNSLPMVVDLTYGDSAKKGRPTQGHDVIACFSYSEPGYGFGEFSLRQTEEGLFLDTEISGPERVKKYLEWLVDNAILDTDQDPERHLLYNKVMGRSCGEECEVCGKGP